MDDKRRLKGESSKAQMLPRLQIVFARSAGPNDHCLLLIDH